MMTRRRILATPLAAAGLMLLTAAPALAQDAATPTASPAAITVATGATVAVTGTGEASGEATGAILQFIMRPDYNDTTQVTDANTGAATQPTVTADQVTAVVDALKKGGVADDNVKSRIADASYVSGSFGTGAAVVVAQLDEKLLAKADRIIDRAGKAGTDAGVVFDPVNVAYFLPDCGQVEQASLAEAVADGEAQAQMLADVMGVTLGGITSVTPQQSYGAYYGGAGGGASSTCDEQPALADGLTAYFSAYDPNKRGEVEIYTTVQMSYAIS
jgi:uncharacterized protein YggE